MASTPIRLIQHACGHAARHRIPGDGITRELHIDMLTISPCPDCAESWAERRRARIAASTGP